MMWGHVLACFMWLTVLNSSVAHVQGKQRFSLPLTSGFGLWLQILLIHKYVFQTSSKILSYRFWLLQFGGFCPCSPFYPRSLSTLVTLDSFCRFILKVTHSSATSILLLSFSWGFIHPFAIVLSWS